MYTLNTPPRLDALRLALSLTLAAFALGCDGDAPASYDELDAGAFEPQVFEPPAPPPGTGAEGEPEAPHPLFQAMYALKNETGAPQEITLWYPRADLRWRCEDLAPDGAEVPVEFFTEARPVSLAPGAWASIPGLPELYEGAQWDEECAALLLELDGAYALFKAPYTSNEVDFYEGMFPERVVMARVNDEGAPVLENRYLIHYEPPERSEVRGRRTAIRARLNLEGSEARDFKIASLDEGPEPGCLSGLLEQDAQPNAPRYPFEICSPVTFPFEVGDEISVLVWEELYAMYNDDAYFGLNAGGSGSYVVLDEWIEETPGPYFMGHCGLSKTLQYKYNGAPIPLGETLGGIGADDPSVPRALDAPCPGGVEYHLVEAEAQVFGACERRAHIEEAHVCITRPPEAAD